MNDLPSCGARTAVESAPDFVLLCASRTKLFLSLSVMLIQTQWKQWTGATEGSI